MPDFVAFPIPTQVFDPDAVVKNFASITDFATAVSGGLVVSDGLTVTAGGATFTADAAAAIAGLPAGFKPAGDWTPLHWGCAGDSLTDDGANLNIALAAYKVAVMAFSIKHPSIVFNGLGLMYRSTVSLDFTGVQAWGATIRNITILSEATGKTAFDLTGSRGGTFTQLMIYGHITNTPRVGIQQARALIGGAKAFCDIHTFIGCGTRGYFTLAAIYNYGGESCSYDGCKWWNSHKDGHCGIFLGKDIYPVESDYLTPTTGEVSFINNLYDLNEFRNLPLGRTAMVTAATNTNPLTVTVDVAPTMVVGDYMTFGSTPFAPIVGMPQLIQFNGQITGIAGNVITFGAVDASGWTSYTSGGMATVAQTVPSLVFGRGNGHKFQSPYIVSYGADGLVIDMSTTAHQITALDFDQALFEGDGQRSHIRFLVGTNSRSLRNFRITNWNFRPQAFAISTDASGGGAIQIQGCVLSFPTEASDGIPKLFENEVKFSLLNAEIVVPEVGSITPSAFTAFSGKVSYISTGLTDHYVYRANGHIRSKIATGGTSVDLKYLTDAGVDAGFLRFSTASGGSWSVSLDGTNVNYSWVPTAFFPGADNTQGLGLINRRWSNVFGRYFRPGLAATPPIWTSGIGSPEGVVAAVPASMYTNESGGAGTTLYVKESGTGNTGWVAK